MAHAILLAQTDGTIHCTPITLANDKTITHVFGVAYDKVHPSQAVADPGFPRWRGALANLLFGQTFYKKLCEHERNWTKEAYKMLW